MIELRSVVFRMPKPVVNIVSMQPIKLVKLPKSLAKGVDQRLPLNTRVGDMRGRKFGSKTVVGFAGFRGSFAVWLCRCKCGRLSVIRGAFMGRYSSKCRCRKRFRPEIEKLQRVYREIIKRCYDPECELYPMYGGRGVKVCRRWRESFEWFAEDMGPRPARNRVILRRNPRGDYSPGNCYWGTVAELHSKSGTLITYKGKTQNIGRWSAELGINRETIRMRVKRCMERGLDPSGAFTLTFKRGPRKKQD
jgi:hypothetical protein